MSDNSRIGWNEYTKRSVVDPFKVHFVGVSEFKYKVPTGVTGEFLICVPDRNSMVRPPCRAAAKDRVFMRNLLAVAASNS